MKRSSGKSVDTPEGKADTNAEGGLARWSRRKAASQKQNTPPANRDIDEPKQLDENNEKLSNEPIEVLTDADMPPLESLDEHSDYSAFLSSGVSEKLRKQALRKLFHLDVYNVVDGLDDYAEDYTKFASLGNILTADVRLQRQRAEKQRNEPSLTDTEEPQTESTKLPGQQADDESTADRITDTTGFTETADYSSPDEKQDDDQGKNRV